MSTLLLRLAGPLQSWGYRSRFSDRDTGLEPSKSGVIGLLCCALGRPRTTDPTDLAALHMHVRVDREGTLLKDFHTAGGGVFRGSRDYFAPTSDGKRGKNPVVTERHYLQDASFLVALEGERALLESLADALKDPRWPLALGRRSCPPSEPVLLELVDEDGPTVLCKHPLRLRECFLPRRWDERAGRYLPDCSPTKLRLVLECASGVEGEMRRDVPVSWRDTINRQYTVRFVRQKLITMTPEVLS